MRIERRRDFRSSLDTQRDPVRDVESRLLAGFLDGADQLPGKTLALQRLGQRRVQAHEEAALLRAGIAFGRGRLDEHVVRLEGDGLAAGFHVEGPAGRDGRRDGAAVRRGERGSDGRNALAESLPDAGQIRLDAVGQQLGVGREHLHRLHVELFQDLRLVTCEERGTSLVGRAHQQSRERLAYSDTARIPRRPS